MGTVSILIEKYRFEYTLYVYMYIYIFTCGFPWWLRWQRICLQRKRPGFDLWVRKILWRKAWQPTAVFLPGKFHGQRSLAGYSSWGRKESDTIAWLTTKASLAAFSYCSEHLQLRRLKQTPWWVWVFHTHHDHEPPWAAITRTYMPLWVSKLKLPSGTLLLQGEEFT